ncbi:hypothetical protein IWW55_005374 [Coemansia sp. RSA 2706]|nr:hypothetical protein IWW55_005374 [Coemansia sp. RSA 2706]
MPQFDNCHLTRDQAFGMLPNWPIQRCNWKRIGSAVGCKSPAHPPYRSPCPLDRMQNLHFY